MLNPPLKLTALAISAITLLTACGGGGGGGSAAGGGNGDGSTPPPSVSGRTIVTPLAAGQDLTDALIERSTAVEITRTSGANPTITVAEQPNATTTITNRNGGVSVTFHSIGSYSFPSTTANADNDGYFSDSNNNRIRFADTGTGYINTIASANAIIGAGGTFYRLNPDFDDTGTIGGFGAAGALTASGQITGLSNTVTYNGRLAIDVYEASTTRARTEPRSVSIPSLTLTANFTTNTISGSASSPNHSGAITFVASNIANAEGGNFGGSLALTGTVNTALGLQTSSLTGSYAGRFFGTNAADVAGVIRFNGTGADGNVLGIGGFRGDAGTPPPAVVDPAVPTTTPGLPSLTDLISSVSIAGTLNSNNTMYNRAVAATQDVFSLAAGASNTMVTMTLNNYNEVLTINGGVWGNSTTDSGLEAGGLSTGEDVNRLINGNHANIAGSYFFYSVTPELDNPLTAQSAPATSRIGYAIIGAAPPNDIATPLGTEVQGGTLARYTGDISIRTATNGSTAANLNPSAEITGTVAMIVDFSNSSAITVRGTASIRSGTATFASTAVDVSNQSRFNSTVSFDANARTALGLTTAPASANYHGGIFGDDVANLVGVLGFRGAGADSNIFGIGGFRGVLQATSASPAVDDREFFSE